MSFADPARSTSSSGIRSTLRQWLAIIGATMVTVARIRILGMAVFGYTLTFLGFSVMQMVLVALIYRDNPALQQYAVVAGFGTALLFGLIFNGGEILDAERSRGTLGNLFLAPVPRFVWLAGFQLFALVESLAGGLLAFALGTLWFSIDLTVNVPSVVLTLVLMTISLWGLSLLLGAAGLLARNANFLSNLLFPFLTLFAGNVYPIALMPDWVRIPARFLPFGYGIEALAAAFMEDASIVVLADSLLPLVGFAVVLPVIGVMAFRRMEREVRHIGSLELA